MCFRSVAWLSEIEILPNEPFQLGIAFNERGRCVDGFASQNGSEFQSVHYCLPKVMIVAHYVRVFRPAGHDLGDFIGLIFATPSCQGRTSEAVTYTKQILKSAAWATPIVVRPAWSALALVEPTSGVPIFAGLICVGPIYAMQT
jgi:hypothetical protein